MSEDTPKQPSSPRIYVVVEDEINGQLYQTRHAISLLEWERHHLNCMLPNLAIQDGLAQIAQLHETHLPRPALPIPRDDIPPCTDPDFAKLSESIRNWRPEFRVGDPVRIRRGTLGSGIPAGIVKSFYWRGAHLYCVVERSNGMVWEHFAANLYEKME